LRAAACLTALTAGCLSSSFFFPFFAMPFITVVNGEWETTGYVLQVVYGIFFVCIS
jgi:hypothetical protein